MASDTLEEASEQFVEDQKQLAHGAPRKKPADKKGS